jgi:GT2 family glycosyltransferase
MSDIASAPATWPRIAVIVVNWNQQEVTLECLASLRAQDYPSAEVILVDNGSYDGTVDTVRAQFPEVTVFQNAENLGFVGGNNVGITHALTAGADYIMLLNNDTIVDRSMLNVLIAGMESDTSIGIAGPKMLYFDQPTVIWCAGNSINWRTGDSVRMHAEEPDGAVSDVQQDVDYITGCGICLRREVVERIGLLDERFFIYYEETDWCMRARAEGWRTVSMPRARLWHKVSAAMGTTSPATDYYMTRNCLLFLVKNRHGVALLVSLAGWSMRTGKILAAYSLKHRSEQRLRSRNARLLGLRDAIVGRWGKMGPDVERFCYGKSS